MSATSFERHYARPNREEVCAFIGAYVDEWAYVKYPAPWKICLKNIVYACYISWYDNFRHDTVVLSFSACNIHIHSSSNIPKIRFDNEKSSAIVSPC